MLNLFASRLAKRTPVFRIPQQANGQTSLLRWRFYSSGSGGHPPGGGGGVQGFPGLNVGPGRMEKGQALAEFVCVCEAHPKLLCPDILLPIRVSTSLSLPAKENWILLLDAMKVCAELM